MLNIFETLESFKPYIPSLSNSLDDIQDFIVPEFLAGDIVRFSPYYESDKGGVGIIKEITMCEFKNMNYDPSDPDSELFIEMPTAIVVSTIPGEQWLDYVPLTHAEIMTLNEVMEEYADTFPEYDAIELFAVRVQIARKLSDIRETQWLNKGYMPNMQQSDHVISLEIAS